jgi:hypothetical protein
MISLWERAGSHRFCTELQRRHLEGLPLKIKALASQLLADAAGMAFSHHELSVENAVIPFSLNLPASSSQQVQPPFEMEHFQ